MNRLALLAALLPPSLARADAVAVRIDTALNEKPALVLTVNKPLSSVVVDLRRDDGKHIRQTSGPIQSGEKRFELDAPAGRSTFSGTLEVVFASGGGGSMPLEFSVETAGPFTIQTSAERLDLAKGEVGVQLTRSAGKCEHEVIIEGKPERQGVTSFNGEPAGTWLTIGWRKHGDDDLVLRIAIRCWDRDGAYHTDLKELFPWKVDIPHEDVNFETGKWDVRASEQPKLERAHREIATAVARYGKWISGVKLYVAGHTDTVGPTAANRTLSMNRARSIAGWFKKRGVGAEIWCAGFGEDKLLYETPDQTDEPRNRRAEYIIGVEKPADGSWKRL